MNKLDKPEKSVPEKEVVDEQAFIEHAARKRLREMNLLDDFPVWFGMSYPEIGERKKLPM